MPNRICACGQHIESLTASAGRPRKYCLSCRPKRVKSVSNLPKTRLCPVCRSIFNAAHPTKRYCSSRCKNRSRYEPGGTYYENPIKCATCGCNTPRFSKSIQGTTRCVQCRKASKNKKKRNPLTWACINCGIIRTRPPTRGQVPKYCSRSCEQIAAWHRRRARMLDAFVEDVNRLEVFVADGYKCYLCGKKTNPLKVYPHPKSPTVDHIVPLSKGGMHERSNCRTACAKCNWSKQDRGGGEQFAIVI